MDGEEGAGAEAMSEVQECMVGHGEGGEGGMRKKRARVIWVVVAGGVIVVGWLVFIGVYGMRGEPTPWERRRLCQDALLLRRELEVKRPESSYERMIAEAYVERWCE